MDGQSLIMVYKLSVVFNG